MANCFYVINHNRFGEHPVRTFCARKKDGRFIVTDDDLQPGERELARFDTPRSAKWFAYLFALGTSLKWNENNAYYTTVESNCDDYYNDSDNIDNLNKWHLKE